LPLFFGFRVSCFVLVRDGGGEGTGIYFGIGNATGTDGVVRYGRDERLTEAYAPDIWVDYY